MSTSSREQADLAGSPALSADGRFLAFTASLDGGSGVFRKDLLTGDVALVAGGDASAPSISADGRYVSFTTDSALDPAIDPGSGSSVYVRDMDVAMPVGGACVPAAPCAYELVSALDGTTQGLSYGAASGALASPRVALSADGRRVAFTTIGASDLASGTPGAATTPGGQVAVRDLDTHRTTLVSVMRDQATGTMEPGVPVPFGAVMPTVGGTSVPAPGAALSADGTTVAWLGEHLISQVPMLADEPQGDGSTDGPGALVYDEPLWRRIADGPLASTRRIVGGGDPLAPGCPPGGTLADDACRGPFPGIAGNVFQRDAETGWLGLTSFIGGVPQLSADGRTVALIGDPDGVANLFLVDMHDGLTRRQAMRQLTREVPLQDPTKAGSSDELQPAGDVLDAAISGDGRRIAFATARSQFPLAPPNLVGPPLGQLGLVELYLLDLDGETIQRITRGPGDGPSLGPPGLAAQGHDGASQPSLSADGTSIAFTSTASDLVPGDANGAGDVFLELDTPLTSTPGAVTISPAPAPLRPKPLWRIASSAGRKPDGTVLLDVVVPGAGRLGVHANAVVRVVSVARHRRRSRLATRRVAAIVRRVHRDGLVAITLRAATRYRSLTRSHDGLEATVYVTFGAAGHRGLRDTLDVVFHVRPKRKAKRR